MTITFRDAKREDTRLLILLAGGTGSGKTESAMRLATGLAGGQKFAVIDTENGRALHKADDYDFKHGDLTEPFTPERYAEAVKAADDAGYPVIVIDSGSHEYDGVGGVLDIQADEFERMGGRDSARMSSWIAPKRRHKAFVQTLLRVRAHVILALRAEDKVEIVKQDGKTVVRPKQSLTGAEGWIPICEKRLPFEATLSLLLTADQPGVPKPIKLERRHVDLVSLTEQISEETGAKLAEWARGGEKTRVRADTDALALSADDFNARLEHAGIDGDIYREVGGRLFPGKTPAQLTDLDRGALWLELERVSSREEDGDRQGAEEVVPEAERESGASPSDSPSATDGTSAPADAEPEPGPEPKTFTAPVGADDDPHVLTAKQAAEFPIPIGKWRGKLLREMLDEGEVGLNWIRWCLRHYETDPLKSHVWAFARVYAPDLYESVMAEKEAAVA